MASFGRMLNAFPDWVVPFAVPAALLLAGLYAWRRLPQPAARPWTRRRVLDAVVLSLTFGLALWMFVVQTARPVYQACRADGWPTARGVVRVCQVLPHEHRGLNAKTTYGLDLRYGFVLDGQGYEGDRYDARPNRDGPQAEMNALARTLSPGTAVTVRYNPRDPDDSMLSTRLPRSQFFFMGAATFFVVVLAVGLVRVVRGSGFRTDALAPSPGTPGEGWGGGRA